MIKHTFNDTNSNNPLIVRKYWKFSLSVDKQVIGLLIRYSGTLPQIGVNPTSSELLVFQHFWSFVTEIRSPMLANKFYKGGFFVNWLHFCCNIIYHSNSLIHLKIIAVPHKVIFLTKCDQEKHFCKPWFAWLAGVLGLLTSILLHEPMSSGVEEHLRNGLWLY